MKSYEELEQENRRLDQENFDLRQFILDWDNSEDDLRLRAKALINRTMPLILWDKD